MEAAPRTNRRPAETGRRLMIVSVWRDLGEPRIGENELRRIHHTVEQAFSQGPAMSPAAIARILADEGAELRHPEVIELDARWREAQIRIDAERFSDLSGLASEKPLRLPRAESLVRQLEKLRIGFERAADSEALDQVRTLAIDAREAATSRAANKSLSEAVSSEQTEIAEWLRIWLQTPNLFESWLELRKSSADFKRKFPGHD
ncbi:MAG TPA: hypothetical protein VKD91_19045 [Pyrinomonadaceae bacterium]|nr:hypothetical protein [Pyrinomonadaceae bacterium]